MARAPPGRGLSESSLGDWSQNQILEHDHDLVPLLDLGGLHAEYGGLTVCDRLSELRAGRSTVFGIWPFAPDDGVEVCGDSLLEVLHDHHAQLHAWLELRRASTNPGIDRAADTKWAAEILPALEWIARQRRPAVMAAAPEDDPVPRLRAAASRADFHSMALLARALYQAGLGPRQVLRECYGVDFPDEFFVIAEAGPHELELVADFPNQPWELAVPLDMGGPRLRPDPGERAERRLLTRDPDLVPLMSFGHHARHGHGDIQPPPAARHGGMMICYSLRGLEARGTEVYGIPSHLIESELSESTSGPRTAVQGASLLTVMHEYFTGYHHSVEWESRQPWSWGANSIDDEELAWSRTQVDQVEALQRRLAQSG
ncbi:hypothetical protein GCM10009527_076380 [Actinomadura nitritigenes]|uniref:Uncharacterized protein n=1 Tax=Actinomadura nitritigenes TaxID=134602 RepID=A0ABS3RHR7_9ACTN|nr:hypothetical protein [Actinomadura nitritigenes]MBO2445149.1 hypothetical protein [Actinomadura nitritigenes]